MLKMICITYNLVYSVGDLVTQKEFHRRDRAVMEYNLVAIKIRSKRKQEMEKTDFVILYGIDSDGGTKVLRQKGGRK
jgi:hypothetical protein